ncbi:MAG TPA: hypothetical protein VNA69_11570 [Thermoanaerobaculia bacterium]|nr:hypothetical protein [Thermoanaerobaculia bacterium]
MRILAMIRFRFLRTIRSAHAVFAIALLAAAIPMLFGSAVFNPAYSAWWGKQDLMRGSAFTAQGAYVLHILVMVTACATFGMRRRSATRTELVDLTETVPVTSSDRFFGDAGGLLASVLAVHVCVLPLLALAFALSPLPTATFFALEAMTLVIAVFISAGAAWNLHTDTNWRNTQLPRSIVVFAVLVVVTLRFTTRGQPFANAAVYYWVEPSRASWNAVARTITSPAMLLACMVLLYFGFLGYYAVQAVRHLERR